MTKKEFLKLKIGDLVAWKDHDDDPFESKILGVITKFSIKDNEVFIRWFDGSPFFDKRITEKCRTYGQHNRRRWIDCLYFVAE